MGRRKDQAQFNMRLSKSLLKRLQTAAKDQDRSVNSEMVHRLERSFQASATQLNAMAQAFLDLAANKVASEKIASETPYRPVPPPPSEVILEARLRAMGALPDDEPELPNFITGGPYDEPDERRRANLRATAEGYRRNAERHESRGAHEKAAEMRKLADEVERDARALTQGQGPHPPVSDQEPELPIPQPRNRQAK